MQNQEQLSNHGPCSFPRIRRHCGQTHCPRVCFTIWLTTDTSDGDTWFNYAKNRPESPEPMQLSDLQDPSMANSEAAKAAIQADDLSYCDRQSAVLFTAQSALHGDRSLISPSAATGVPAQPFIKQSAPPSAKSTAAPPQSLFDQSQTGGPRPAFHSAFSHTNRDKEDGYKCENFKTSANSSRA
jgi:hypothetical protein